MRKGFTLSEVLLVLSVIGVVAALTIPTLVQKVSNDQLKTSWKKAFSDISQASIKMTADNNGSLSGLFTNSNTMKDKFANYFNVVKNCGSGANAGCWHNDSAWTNIQGNAMTTGNAAVVLNNGSLLLFQFGNTACSGACGWIGVDVNGYSKPNAVGKDIFLAYIRDGSTAPLEDSWGCENGTGYWAGAACSVEYLYR